MGRRRAPDSPLSALARVVGACRGRGVTGLALAAALVAIVAGCGSSGGAAVESQDVAQWEKRKDGAPDAPIEDRRTDR